MQLTHQVNDKVNAQKNSILWPLMCALNFICSFHCFYIHVVWIFFCMNTNAATASKKQSNKKSTSTKSIRFPKKKDRYTTQRWYNIFYLNVFDWQGDHPFEACNEAKNSQSTFIKRFKKNYGMKCKWVPYILYSFVALRRMKVITLFFGLFVANLHLKLNLKSTSLFLHLFQTSKKHLYQFGTSKKTLKYRLH